MYFVEDHHEAIIDRDTYDAVIELLQQKKEKYGSEKEHRRYPFTSMLTCGLCGARYRRKTTAAGTKYEKAVWICRTFNHRGKAACASRQIPETILKEVSAKALGTGSFDEALFKDRIAGIEVLNDYTLDFHFKDGATKSLKWENKSRRESWTPEMKKKASEKRLEVLKNGKCNGN